MEHTPSLAEFEAMTAAAFAALPEDVRAACAGVVVRVEDWPSGDQLSGFDAM